ncbi:MAG: hypothetical protein AVDCRST_MAG50-1109 [uncultured Acidimicrobiales bacterium]|uniref:GP-PDE domain-containing protein n=1 Tax=uncultured Acidimicrobiales bacterium TaxID=310071 RepID=A0A6J4HSN3_9ACTN|nr:MAG: hypothetical protein AVDCRST_MAG50-1109 [uncultured Acidimicrobiales bacterium]
MVIGHRGLGKGVVDGHVENTRASFQAAVDAGVQWLETDVRACGDGTLVLAHHPTTAEGRFFSELSFAEASACGVATLDELLDWVPDGVGLNLEVKSSLEDAVKPRGETTAARFAARVADIRREHRLLVTSFDPSALLIVREHAPEVAIGLLGWVAYPLRKVIPAAAHLGCSAVVGHAAAFGPNSTDSAPFHREASWAVRVAHDAGLAVGAWCPGPDAAVQLIEAGVDAVIVNEVPAVLAALRPEPRTTGS